MTQGNVSELLLQADLSQHGAQTALLKFLFSCEWLCSSKRIYRNERAALPSTSGTGSCPVPWASLHSPVLELSILKCAVALRATPTHWAAFCRKSAPLDVSFTCLCMHTQHEKERGRIRGLQAVSGLCWPRGNCSLHIVTNFVHLIPYLRARNICFTYE